MPVQEISCLWEKVTEELVGQIKSNAYAAGDRFYSADEISARFGISNITSRRVLAELARMNLIQKSRGRGCVINKSHQLKKIYVMFHDKEIPTSNLRVLWRSQCVSAARIR